MPSSGGAETASAPRPWSCRWSGEPGTTAPLVTPTPSSTCPTFSSVPPMTGRPASAPRPTKRLELIEQWQAQPRRACGHIQGEQAEAVDDARGVDIGIARRKVVRPDLLTLRDGRRAELWNSRQDADGGQTRPQLEVGRAEGGLPCRQARGSERMLLPQLGCAGIGRAGGDGCRLELVRLGHRRCGEAAAIGIHANGGSAVLLAEASGGELGAAALDGTGSETMP